MKTLSNSSSKNNRSRYYAITPRRVIIVACVLIVAGYVLMSGPGSTEQSFNPDIFSHRRIVIAPILCLTGYLLIIVGILRKSNEPSDKGTGILSK